MGFEEVWVDIKGYEGLYKVSNTGKIKSLKYHSVYRELELIPDTFNNNYYRVSLSKDKKVKRVSIHRIVALTFIPNPFNLPIINHIDGNIGNNNANNLEWCTNSHNIKEGYRLNGNPYNCEKSKNVKLTNEQVLDIKEKLKLKVRQNVLAKLYNVNQCTISDIKNNKTWWALID